MVLARGFTVLELLFTLIVAMVLTTLVIPSFSNLMLDSRRTVRINAFIRAIHLARNESVKQSRPMTLCKTADGQRCGGGQGTWGDGWMIFADEVGDLDASRMLHYRPKDSQETTSSIRGNRRQFIFHPFHRRQTNGTLTFCDSRGASHARAVIVSYTGRPRVDSRAPGGRALTCPG